jgi:hypothetical protein
MAREVMLTTEAMFLRYTPMVLLFRIEWIAASGLGDLDIRRLADPIGRMGTPVTMGGEIEKSSCN